MQTFVTVKQIIIWRSIWLPSRASSLSVRIKWDTLLPHFSPNGRSISFTEQMTSNKQMARQCTKNLATHTSYKHTFIHKFICKNLKCCLCFEIGCSRWDIQRKQCHRSCSTQSLIWYILLVCLEEDCSESIWWKRMLQWSDWAQPSCWG